MNVDLYLLAGGLATGICLTTAATALYRRLRMSRMSRRTAVETTDDDDGEWLGKPMATPKGKVVERPGVSTRSKVVAARLEATLRRDKVEHSVAYTDEGCYVFRDAPEPAISTKELAAMPKEERLRWQYRAAERRKRVEDVQPVPAVSP